jgi:methylated-DNA-protein-cysteine methyltransferase-like protein
MNYGQIATILGQPRAARAVGYALKACTKEPDPVPWQRVINVRGTISARSEVERPLHQRELLEGEGVIFREDDSCDLTIYRWEPPEPEAYLFNWDGDMPFR